MAARNVSCRECGEPQKARGLCKVHYDKLWRSGQLKTARTTRRDVTLRDALGRKNCIKCDKRKAEADFAKGRLRKDGLAPYCKQCVREDWRRSYRDGVYGLPQGTVAKMLAKQNYRCAVCRKQIGESASVDHDHSCCPELPACGKCVRGILCVKCNTYMGYIADSVEVYQSAIAYLQRR